jgi:hypothetical protein
MVLVMRKRRQQRRAARLARMLVALDEAAREERPWWRVRRVARAGLGTSRA